MQQKFPYKRADRVSDLLRSIISEALSYKVHHRNLDLVTITEVKLSPDMKHADVFFRVFDQSKLGSIKESLELVSPKVQKEISKNVTMKYVPKIHFVYDESLDYGYKIDKLLEDVRGEEE
ncbi:MAG: 30S ribosome-binding factor RbfA [Bdellovibrionales bacterium]|nr:30S ribosome-binding factor RbfA [Bdellovibrionales bacterium]